MLEREVQETRRRLEAARRKAGIRFEPRSNDSGPSKIGNLANITLAQHPPNTAKASPSSRYRDETSIKDRRAASTRVEGSPIPNASPLVVSTYEIVPSASGLPNATEKGSSAHQAPSSPPLTEASLESTRNKPDIPIESNPTFPFPTIHDHSPPTTFPEPPLPSAASPSTVPVPVSAEELSSTEVILKVSAEAPSPPAEFKSFEVKFPAVKAKRVEYPQVESKQVPVPVESVILSSPPQSSIVSKSRETENNPPSSTQPPPRPTLQERRHTVNSNRFHIDPGGESEDTVHQDSGGECKDAILIEPGSSFGALEFLIQIHECRRTYQYNMAPLRKLLLPPSSRTSMMPLSPHHMRFFALSQCLSVP